jgi:uncharacterized protein YjiS (DUF1127 family)
MPPFDLTLPQFNTVQTAPDACSRWLAAFRKWRRRRKAIADLQALSDRSLADIGIERSEIRSVVMSGSRDASRFQRWLA